MNKKIFIFIILILLVFITSIFVINNQIKVKNKYKNKFEDLVELKNEFSNLQRDSYVELDFFQKEKININSGYEYYEFKDEYNFLISNGPRGYLDFYDDYLFLITGTGKIFFKNLALYLESENINNISKLKFTSIESDFRKFADEEYLDYFKEVVKDFTIVNDIVFISYIKKKSEDCYFNAVAKSNLNFNKLIFEDVIVFDECYPSHHYQSGGAIEFKNKNEFFITIGDYHTSEEIDSKFINSPQDPSLNFGKIYLVNFIEKTSKLISLGHRNPQGIFYDKENDILFNAEHGPQGGDEININKKLSEISNFGWPISSYGNHSIDDPKLYELVPLNKSHEKYGFIEPLKQFTPSIGISEIDFISSEYFELNENNNSYLAVGSMSPNDGGTSLYILTLDKDYNLINEFRHEFYNRIRDVIFIKKYDLLLLFNESNGSIIAVKFQK